MNYRTTCPHCTSIFLLGEDQLGAAQGWVQCSVCGAAFDAQPSLLMADGSPLPLAEPEPTEPSLPPADEILEPTLLPEPLPEVDETSFLPSEAELTAPFSLPGINQRELSAVLPSIILIDPELPYPEDDESLPQIDVTPADTLEQARRARSPSAACS